MNTTVDALTALRAALDSIELSLPLDSAARGNEVHGELLGQIDDYLLPRLARLDAPLLVVRRFHRCREVDDHQFTRGCRCLARRRAPSFDANPGPRLQRP